MHKLEQSIEEEIIVETLYDNYTTEEL